MGVFRSNEDVEIKDYITTCYSRLCSQTVRQRCTTMAEVMNSHILQPGAGPDDVPRFVQVLDMGARLVAGDHPGIAGNPGQLGEHPGRRGRQRDRARSIRER